MSETLTSQFEFIKHAQSLKNIERAVQAGGERNENSAEHSWSVALLLWTLEHDFEDEFGTKLDSERMMKMALMHDLVEIETGDVSVWDGKKRTQTERNEGEIFVTLTEKLPHSFQSELSDLWTELQKGKTMESRLVHGVDRLSGAIQRLVTGQGWVNEGHGESDLDDIQLEKISCSRVLTDIYTMIKREAKEKDLLRED